MIERAVTVRKWWSSQLDRHIGSSAVFIRCRSLVELASLVWMFCRQDWGSRYDDPLHDKHAFGPNRDKGHLGSCSSPLPAQPLQNSE